MTKEKPTIVCLCGSTRFYEAFQKANYDETMAGRIVLTVGFYPHSSEQAHGEKVGATDEQKQALDELHLRKIDLCDEIFVLNVDGYVGESTLSEIAYAVWRNKKLRWIEEPLGGTENWLFNNRHCLNRLIAKHAGYPVSVDKTINLTDDIEGLGKQGEEVDMAKLFDFAATKGFEMGYERKRRDEGETVAQTTSKDPIHEEKGKWYFWDETGADRQGPFETEEEARAGMKLKPPKSQRDWRDCNGPGSRPIPDKPGWTAPCSVCKFHHNPPTTAKAQRPKKE